MDSVNNADRSSDRAHHPAGMLTLRTYREIAEILSKRHGAPISTPQVRHICLAAERQLIHAIRNDRDQSMRTRRMAQPLLQ